MTLVDRLSSVLRRATRSPAVRRGARDLSRAALRALQGQRPGTGGDERAAGRDQGRTVDGEGAQALRDRTGRAPVALTYAPHEDDHPDPGEVVWAWVPFEEDLRRGKDRPVLVLAEEAAAAGGSDGSGQVLVALMLTSRDRADQGGVSTDEHGATWVDIGAGDWDSQGRPSEVRADRLLRLAPEAVRREGGRLDRSCYEKVAEAVAEVHGWRG